jgi:hypothetical protein
MDISSLQTIFEQNKYVFTIMGIVIVGSIVFNIVRLGKTKASNRNFLADHPDAAKVYLTTKALITSEAVTVYTVEGEKPQNFFETGKTGFYLSPGKSTVEISYTHSRPGVLHKNVTETFGPVKKELVTEANKSYLLGFDRKDNTFTFEEI